MIYTSNTSTIVSAVKKKLEALKNPDEMLRQVALGILSEIKVRVHKEGKAASGEQIGTYSPGYMKLRTGNYGNAATYQRGPKKGEVKQGASSDPGTYTKGINKGQSRPKYNRDGSTKVIFSLTRQMENDLSVIAIPNGYGIGYKNAENFNKSQWVEKIYNKPVWKLSDEEKKIALNIAEDYIQAELNGEEKRSTA